MTDLQSTQDFQTAMAFSTSWNNLPSGSVYTREQVLDWISPLTPEDFKDKNVLELGCGNASLMYHIAKFGVKHITGIDLGNSVTSAKKNMDSIPHEIWTVQQADLTEFTSEGYDIVYSIGVLHHLKNPTKGFESVLRNTKPGGQFHCWVYAHEGNAVIRLLVEPLRKICCHLPWQITKYGIATPLALPFWLYAKILALFPEKFTTWLPLQSYCRWIANREFAFFRHVAFDQLVTPQTAYIHREQVETWLADLENAPYIIMRNGNSWKFGGTKPCPSQA